MVQLKQRLSRPQLRKETHPTPDVDTPTLIISRKNVPANKVNKLAY